MATTRVDIDLATLQRIAAVLDEELLVCFQRTVGGEIEQDFAASPDAHRIPPSPARRVRTGCA